MKTTTITPVDAAVAAAVLRTHIDGQAETNGVRHVKAVIDALDAGGRIVIEEANHEEAADVGSDQTDAG